MLERIFAFSMWTKLVPEVTKTTVTGCLEPSLGRIVNPGASVIYPEARGGISIGATTLRISSWIVTSQTQSSNKKQGRKK